MLLSLTVLLGLLPVPACSASTNELSKWQELMTGSVKALRNNQLTDAVSLCNQATQLAAAFGTNDVHLSQSQTLRAEIYMWEKRNDLAEQTFKEAVASCEKAVGSNDRAMVHPLSSLANFYYFVLARYDQVILLFERILRIVESSPTRNDRDVILWSRNLASVYQQTGRFDRAEPLFKRALALAEKTDPEWLPYELLTAADFYRAWSKPDRAESLAQRALAIREKNLAVAGTVDARLDVAVALDNLGAIYLAWNKPAQAESAYRRSLDLVQTFMDPGDADLAPRLTGLAEALRLQHKPDQAEPLFRRALAITEKNAGPDSKEAAAIRAQCATLLNDTNRSSSPELQAGRSPAASLPATR
jgi:tetratricopeptide (TPR) repeat protein